MPKPSQVVIDRLRVVQEQILSTPEFYDQNTFGETSPCGTVCCIAGWLHYNEVGAKEHTKAVKAGRGWDFGDVVEDAGKMLLEYTGGGDKDEYDLGPNLFATAGEWPSPFEEDYYDAKTPKQRAQVAVRRIEHFIETGE